MGAGDEKIMAPVLKIIMYSYRVIDVTDNSVQPLSSYVD